MRTQAELKSLGLLIHSVRYMLGAELGLYNMGEMVSRKVMCVRVHTCMCFLSLASFVSSCLASSLNTGNRGGSDSRAVLWILCKALMEERGMSIKSVFSMQLFLCSCHPVGCFLILREQTSAIVTASNEAQIPELPSGLSTGSLPGDEAGVHMYIGGLHVSIDEG